MDGRLLQHAVRTEVCVLSLMHLSAEACRVTGPTAFKIGFPADHAYQHQWKNYNETYWWCQKSIGVHYEDYKKCDSVVKVCGVHT